MTKTTVMTILMTIFLICASSLAAAVDVAPRISDREIIEGLSELKQGNRDINKRIDDVNKRIDDLTQSVNKRFDDLTQSVNKRFDDVNGRIDDLKDNINLRFDDMNQRFVSIDQRFISMEQRIDGMQNGLQNLIIALFSSVMALIIMLIGYMVWDRKTAQQPMRARLTALEKQVSQQLNPNDTAHSIVARLLAVQRRMARNDSDLADAMRAETLL